MTSEFKYNFCGIPEIPLKKAKFIILPIPYESTVSFQVGTKFGPESILFSSRQMELYDEELEKETYKVGIKTVGEIIPKHSSTLEMVKEIENVVFSFLKKDKIVIGLGGEHTISIGIFNALQKKNPEIKVLHLDAHGDLRDEYEGTKYSHACVIRRMLEKKCNIYSIGIRSISGEEANFLKREKAGIKINFGYKMKKNWFEEIPNTLPSGKYFITIDVDFFDPSIVPDTGTPEPGGFFWYETIKFFKNFLFRKDIEVFGFDVVELAPKNFFSPSCFLISKLIYKLIGYISYKR